MRRHKVGKGNTMFDHNQLKGCSGFNVQILQEITPVQDIAAMEDLWIILIKPSINKNPKLDPFALYNFYWLSISKKLSSGGLEALKQ